MLLKRSSTSSISQSKRFHRKLRNIFDGIKFSGRVGSGSYKHVFPVFLVLLFVFMIYNLFAIKNIDCEFDHKECSLEVTGRLEKFKGTNVLLLNHKQLTESLHRSFSTEKVVIGFKMFNNLKVELYGGNPPVVADVILTQPLPTITMDIAPGSTTSASWPKPSTEIKKFQETASASAFSLYDSGQMIPASTGSSNFKYIISKKPDEEVIKSIYRLIKLLNKYTSADNITVLGDRLFLSQSGQPDIIVSVPYDENSLIEALRSLSYLSSLKKDAKVIDLRFKNPIIR